MVKEKLRTVIVSPFFESRKRGRRRPPINVLPMATGIEQQGISAVKVVDGESLGLSFPELTRLILKNHPQIVGVSVCTPAYPEAKKLVERIKTLCPGIITVFGGKHPTHYYREVLKNRHIDFVVVGEGEEVFKKIIVTKALYSTVDQMRKVLANEPGVAFRGKRDVQLAPKVNLNQLPPINWKILYPHLEFYRKSHDAFLIESSRGCFGKCVFCLAARYRQGISFKQPRKVVQELKKLFNHGFKHFFFTDDDLMLSYLHIYHILQMVINSKIKIKLEANVRADSLVKCVKKNPKFLFLAKKAGMVVLHIGIESGSPEILEYCQKRINLKQVQQAICYASKAGIIVETNFIVGLPYESFKTSNESINYALSLRKFGPHLPHISIFMPYPGTDAFEDAIEERLLNPTTLDFARFDVHRGAVIPTKFLKKKEVNSIYRVFYQRLYSPDFLSYLKHRQPAVFKVAQKILKSISISTLFK